jgi:hypothetical protein
MRWLVGGKTAQGSAASPSQMGLERQSDLRRSARHRLQRPLRPHLLSSAVRHRMARASPILTSKVTARPGRSAPRASVAGWRATSSRQREGRQVRRRCNGRSTLSRPRRTSMRRSAWSIFASAGWTVGSISTSAPGEATPCSAIAGAVFSRRGGWPTADHARRACRRIRRVARACALNRSARLR